MDIITRWSAYCLAMMLCAFSADSVVTIPGIKAVHAGFVYSVKVFIYFICIDLYKIALCKKWFNTRTEPEENTKVQTCLLEILKNLVGGLT